MTKRCRILSVDPDGARAKVFFIESESCDLCQDGCGASGSCARGLSVLSAVNGKGLALSPGMIVLIRAPRRAAVIQFIVGILAPIGLAVAGYRVCARLHPAAGEPAAVASCALGALIGFSAAFAAGRLFSDAAAPQIYEIVS